MYVSYVTPQNGLPVIIKAAMGGGGKGMRVVRKEEDLVPFFESASSEALASFGDGSVFIEYVRGEPFVGSALGHELWNLRRAQL